jgi:hypothetical protein
MTESHTTIEFAAPGALNTAVTGSQRSNSQTEFNFLSPVSIISAIHEVDPAATISYDLGVRRGNTITVFSSTPDMLRSNNQGVGLRAGFPTAPILPGVFQFVVLQRAGALTATNIRLIANKPVF